MLGAIVTDNDHCEDAFTAEMVAAIWLATTEGRPFRHLGLDYYAYYADSGSLDSRFDEFHPDFLKNLLLASLDIMNAGQCSTNPTDQDRCYYHEHDQKHPNCPQKASIPLYSKYGKPQLK